MAIKNAIDLGNGQTALEVVDMASGLVSNYVIQTGTLTAFMRELRNKN